MEKIKQARIEQEIEKYSRKVSEQMTIKGTGRLGERKQDCESNR